MTLRHGGDLADTPSMAERSPDESVVMVGWTEDDLDHLAEVVAVEESIAEAFDDDTRRVRVVRPRRVLAQDAAAPPRVPIAPPPPRLAVTKDVAAQMLSMSVDSLERHVLPDVRSIRVGGLVRIPTTELDRWVADRAARALGDR